MIHFFQVLFLISAVVVLVLHVLEFNKWQEGRKETGAKPHTIKWIPFIITGIVALGCLLNVVFWLFRKG